MRHEPEGKKSAVQQSRSGALHGVLMRIRDLGLKLVSFNRIGPTVSS
jgi:hypothetical protein